MQKKQIELIATLSIAGALLLSMGGVVASSYFEYKNSYDSVMDKNISEDNKNLRSLSVSLKEGVEYYANGLASPSKEDLIVTASFGGTYTEPLNVVLQDDEYELKVDNNFSLTGGKISVHYNGRESSIIVDLKKVVPISLTIKENPYIICYSVNDVFSKEGMVVEANYNDGTTSELHNYEISNNNPLTKEDKEIIISYKEGEVEVKTKIDIKVLDKVDNGEIESFDLGECYVNNGEKLTSIEKVLGKYANGNKKILNSNEYSIEANDVAILGKEYPARITLVSNNKISKDIKASVVSKQEAENVTYNNLTQNKKSVASYIYNKDGSFKENGTINVDNGSFKLKANAFDSTKRKSIKFNFDAGKHTDADLYVRCANYNWDGASMNVAHYDYMFDLYVNGSLTKFSKDAIIPGFTITDSVAKGFGYDKALDMAFQVFFDINLANINLLNGNNEIELVLNLKDNVEKNYWSETADIKIDYFNVVVDKEVPVHNVNHVNGDEPSCNKPGTIEHYKCETCNETFKDKDCSEIILDTYVSSGDHQYGDYIITDENHKVECKNCDHFIEEAHKAVVSKYDNNEHWEECICGKKINVGKHKLSEVEVKSTKVYKIGETLDSNFIKASSSCECGYEGSSSSNLSVTFNEEKASSKSKATVIYNNNTYIVHIPVDDLHMEAENSNIQNDDANYQLTYEEYEIEKGTGKNGTDTLGLKSLKGDTKKDANGNPVWQNTKITMKIYSDTKRDLSISMLAASTFNGNGRVVLENVLDMKVNGENASFADDAILKGGGVKWFGWEDVHVANITLKKGENIIEMVVNYDSNAGKQSSGQGPFNIDYFYFKYL